MATNSLMELLRLPNALAGLGTVGLIYYLLGRRMAGRSVGLIFAIVFYSLGLFIAVKRQTGPDGLLSDYLPCLPGPVLLGGMAWVWLVRQARRLDRGGTVARGVLQAHWVAIFVIGLAAPLVLRSSLPGAVWPWSVAVGLIFSTAAVASVLAWKRGGDAVTLVPLAMAAVIGVNIASGVIAPAEVGQRGRQALVSKLAAPRKAVASPSARDLATLPDTTRR